MNYLNWREIDGYGCPVNIIETNRGYGKSYGWKKKCVKMVRRGGKFVYVVRRPQNWKDITDKKLQIFPDVNQDLGENIETKKAGFFRGDEQVGYIVELSKAQSVKPASFADVQMVIFDEFLIENDSPERYLPQEPVQLMNLFDTIARNRSDVKLYMVGNASVLYNPYVIFWNLRLPKKGRISISDNRRILLFIGVSEEFIQQRKETLAGELMRGTSYEAFALYNQFAFDNMLYLDKVPKGARYYVSIKAAVPLAVYTRGKYFYVSQNYEKRFPRVLVLPENVSDERETVAHRSNFYVVLLKKLYLNGFVRYENVKVKELFIGFISAFL